MKRAAVSRGIVAAAVSAFMLLAAEARSQSTTSPSQQQQDRSFYLDTPVTHPEDLSGVWEVPDGHGGAIGIHLILDTTAPVDATTLVGTKQKWLGLTVGLCHRNGVQLQLGEESLFSDSLRGGSVRYEDGRLTLHASGYDLDLHRIAGDQWSGRFHRENFDSQVTLARPVVQATSKATWFLGTWKSTEGAGPQCLHIAQQWAGGYIAWSDTLTAWGSVRFAPQVPKPPYSWEHYGDLAKVDVPGNGRASIELYAYNPLCCSQTFTATTSDGGRTMKAEWVVRVTSLGISSTPGLNQSPHKSKWTKMPGNTCIVSQ